LDLFNLERILKYLPGIVIGLTVHEFSHAWVAHLSGDPTSREQGRITLNPLKHIDAIGLIFLFIVGFGWAKPVQFNEQFLRKKIDVLKIAFAGPASNAITAMLFSLLFVGVYKIMPSYNSAAEMIIEMIYYAIYINWGLFIFNLIPIPPLDGSHLLFYPLRRYPDIYDAFYKYGSLLFLGLLIISSITKFNLLPVLNIIRFFADGFLTIIGYK
jgi:Zn-dependent protease